MPFQSKSLLIDLMLLKDSYTKADIGSERKRINAACLCVVETEKPVDRSNPAELQIATVELSYSRPQTQMDSDQLSTGFSISDLLGFDRRSESQNNSRQQNLSEETGKSECALLKFDQLHQVINCLILSYLSNALYHLPIIS